jgi:hypothetical protein
MLSAVAVRRFLATLVELDCHVTARKVRDDRERAGLGQAVSEAGASRA